MTTYRHVRVPHQQHKAAALARQESVRSLVEDPHLVPRERARFGESDELERIQGLLSANHRAFNNRLRLALTVTTSRENDKYITYENTGGFEGGVFQNVAIFNPTQPVTVTDSTGTHYYETGSTSVRNPVALANQVENVGNATRTLGNATAELDIAGGLTGQVTVGLDHASGGRQT